MSDAEIRRRKKVQGNISHTTSTLGLGALATTGVAALAARKPGVLRAVQKIPKLGKVTPQKMKDTAVTTGLISGGIGGVGGYNFASYTNAESRKRQRPMVVQPKKIKKGMDMGLEMGHYGEEGRPVELPVIEPEQELVEKAWSPVASNYSPEGLRHKRAKKYETGLETASLGTAAAAFGVGTKGLRAEAKNHSAGQVKASSLPKVKAAQSARRASAVKNGKVALGLAGASVATGIGAEAVHRKRKSDWQSYGKRDNTSAFGVDHTE